MFSVHLIAVLGFNQTIHLERAGYKFQGEDDLSPGCAQAKRYFRETRRHKEKEKAVPLYRPRWPPHVYSNQDLASLRTLCQPWLAPLYCRLHPCSYCPLPHFHLPPLRLSLLSCFVENGMDMKKKEPIVLNCETAQN